MAEPYKTVAVSEGTKFEDIVAIIEGRRAQQSPMMRMMQAVRLRYEGDYVIPDPSGMTDDATPVLTPALIAAAVDAPALRAASVLPNVFVPALDPTKLGTGPKGTEYARARRGAILASWDKSALPLLIRRSFRFLRAYDAQCMVVEPGTDRSEFVPKIVLRDPLGTYPEPKAPEDITLPKNCGFIYCKSGMWIRSVYPRARQELGGPIPPAGRNVNDELWDLVEWIDESHTVIGILGPRVPPVGSEANNGASARIELSRYENLAHCCPVVASNTVSLSQVASQVAKIIGHADLQAQILALDIAATQKSIYPDRYIIGDGTKNPRLISGPGWKDGLTGEVNIIADAKQIGELRGAPDQNAARIAQTLQENAERTVGLLPQMGGQLSGAARTGRGLDTLASYAVDPAIQEIQEVMGFTLRCANRAILETYKGYEADRKFHVFFGVGGSGAFADFKPSKEIAETTESAVSYAIAGADKQGTTVGLGQMLGTKLISHKSARRKHPDIDDPDQEEINIDVEDTNEALKMSVLARAGQPDSPGSLSLEDMAKLAIKVATGMGFAAALLKVNEERAEVQAATPDQAAQMPPVDAMPGLAGPQEGTAGALPSATPEGDLGAGMQGPPEGLDRLRQLTGALAQTSGR